jgi:hypothetical protein
MSHPGTILVAHREEKPGNKDTALMIKRQVSNNIQERS